MVIEALKAARDFIENDRQVLAESLTVNGEIVFEDDTDRRAMAEYVSVLVVIDGALEQALAAPVQAVPELAANVPGLADDPSAFIRWALKNNYDTSSHPMFFVMLDPKTNAARMGWKAAVAHYELATPPAAQPAPVPLTDEQISEIAAQGHKRWLEFARAIEAAHGITKGQS